MSVIITGADFETRADHIRFQSAVLPSLKTMGVRTAIVVCATSFLLGTFSPIYSPYFTHAFYRCFVHPLDRRLPDALEVTRHR